MAVDETLLDSALAGVCTVRWYRWDQATLSLGYFQTPAQARADSALRDLPIVRRLSGGGAIIHDRELTYSCAVPAQHPLAKEPRRLYAAVHEQIIAGLANFGFYARLRGETMPAHGKEYLCFSRMDDFDVVMAGHKVLGSAQRRRKGAILQHGSLVLERSAWAPQFPGVFDCGGKTSLVDHLIERLSMLVSGIFYPNREYSRLTEFERRTALELATRSMALLQLEIQDSQFRHAESV